MSWDSIDLLVCLNSIVLVAVALVLIRIIQVLFFTVQLLLVLPSLRFFFILFESFISVLATTTNRLRATNGLLRVTPTARLFSSVHLWEKKAKNCFSICPIKIIKLDSDFLVWLGRVLMALKVLFRKFAAWFDQGKELWFMETLLCRHFRFKLSSLLLLDLFHRLEEELLDVWSLVKDHLANWFEVRAFLVLLTNWFVQVFKLFMLFPYDLLILELKQLAFLLKVGHNLDHTLFKEVDLRLHQLYLLVLFKLFLCLLLHRHSIFL